MQCALGLAQIITHHSMVFVHIINKTKDYVLSTGLLNNLRAKTENSDNMHHQFKKIIVSVRVEDNTRMTSPHFLLKLPAK